jgi:hypothetical protein
VAPLAIAFGLLLGILGAGFYYGTGMVSVTALIPAFFGAALVLLGLLALGLRFRMHAMHLAALVGLVGTAIPAYRVIRGYATGAEMKLPAVAEQIAMAVICAVFLVLCVHSFISARRRRRQHAVVHIEKNFP